MLNRPNGCNSERARDIDRQVRAIQGSAAVIFDFDHLPFRFSRDRMFWGTSGRPTHFADCTASLSWFAAVMKNRQSAIELLKYHGLSPTKSGRWKQGRDFFCSYFVPLLASKALKSNETNSEKPHNSMDTVDLNRKKFTVWQLFGGHLAREPINYATTRSDRRR